MNYTDSERLDFLIRNGGWRAPGTNIYGKHYPGEWTRHDGRGCDDSVTPSADDPRHAIDLALEAEQAPKATDGDCLTEPITTTP